MVLSESTERYDRGRKFLNYRQIPTLREYLLVSQWEPQIEVFFRQPDGTWVFSEVNGNRTTLELRSLDISVSLARIFAKVEFGPNRVAAR